MEKRKYIEDQNIPFTFGTIYQPEFLIHKIENVAENMILHYLVDGRGFSVHFENHSEFQKFPNYFKVESGGWYGDKGRWAPIERYTGTIICEDTKEIIQVAKSGSNFKFEISKPPFSKNKILMIESEFIGVQKIKCKRIVPQEYDISLYSIKHEKWILRKQITDNLKSYMSDAF